MPIRPPSSVCRNCRNPLFTGPSTFSFGTIASWKINSRVSEARHPSLSSFLPERTPRFFGRSDAWPIPTRLVSSRSQVSLVTINAVIPCVRFALASVRAVTQKISPTPAWVMKIFEPLST